MIASAASVLAKPRDAALGARQALDNAAPSGTFRAMLNHAGDRQGDGGAPAENRTAALARGKTREDLLRVSRDFEAFFLATLMRDMRGTVKRSKLFDGGHGERIWQPMLEQRMSQDIAGAGRVHLGIADALYRRFSALLPPEKTGSKNTLPGGSKAPAVETKA